MKKPMHTKIHFLVSLATSSMIRNMYSYNAYFKINLMFYKHFCLLDLEEEEEEEDKK